MIDKTNSAINTPHSEVILSIMATDERLEKYTVTHYRPEMRYSFNGCEWDVFVAENNETDKNGYLAYSDEDGVDFVTLKTVKRRVRNG